MKNYVLLPFIAATLFSCTKDSPAPAPPTPTPPAAPVANFTYSGATLAPATISFSNQSTNATSYLWDFGDGGNSTSTLNSPSYTYTKGGTYTVKLTATGAGGSNSTTKTVNITAPTTLKIMSVKVSVLPLTKSNGGSWDDLPSSGPDVSIKITDEAANTTLYTWPFVYNNVVASTLPLNFVIENSLRVATPLIITSANFSKKIAFELWDKDTFDEEFMTGVIFAPSILTTGADAYPTTFTATISGLTAVFTLKWE
jgi:PKD repeat protein